MYNIKCDLAHKISGGIYIILIMIVAFMAYINIMTDTNIILYHNNDNMYTSPVENHLLAYPKSCNHIHI